MKTSLNPIKYEIGEVAGAFQIPRVGTAILAVYAAHAIDGRWLSCAIFWSIPAPIAANSYMMKLSCSTGRFMKTSVCFIASGMFRNGGQGVKPKALYSDTALFI